MAARAARTSLIAGWFMMIERSSFGETAAIRSTCR